MEDEFSFIKNKLRPLAFERKEARGLSDDCALFPNIDNLVVSVDSSIEGIHVPIGTDISVQARRAILRAISDLATLGAKPLCVFSAINIPKLFRNMELDNIAIGFRKALIEYDIFLAGGDISCYSGPLIFSITALGDKGNNKLSRNGARKGDLIVLSGEIGDSFVGLNLLTKKIVSLNIEEDKDLINKFLIPNPKIETGLKITNFSTSIIDISDGLVADLEHICKNSNVGAEIYLKDIPFSTGSKKYIDSNVFNYVDLITGGDDYELLFTINPEDINKLDQDLYVIGKVIDGEGVKVYSVDNNLVGIKEESRGYKHFK
jgi:thiamine-monophosphate kinase